MSRLGRSPTSTGPGKPGPKKKKHPVVALAVNLVLIAVAFGLLALAIHGNRDQIRDVFRRSIDGRLFALGFGIYMCGLLVTCVRWYLLVRVIEPTFRLRDSVLLGFIGNVFNLLIPGAVGGDLIKAAYLARMRIKKTQAIASMVIDRIVGLLGLFVLAGVAGLVAWSRAPVDVRRLTVVVWVAIVVGFLTLAAIFAQAVTRRYPGLLEGYGRLSLLLRELRELSISYQQSLGVVFLGLVLSCFCHSMNVLAFYTVSRALFPTGLPTLAEHFLMVPLILFTTAVPLPFGALGLSEHVGQRLFELVQHPQGALGTMAFRVLMYGGGLICACFYLANLRQVRALTDTAHHIEEELLEGDIDRLEEPEYGAPPLS
jgi:uncharacterized protein (TIRG00374 family)